MPDQFDPYSQWLGIVEPQRPVNYYVLLGVSPAENDTQKIAQAADLLAARVRRIRPGAHLAQWSALLDEIAAAKACLTDPVARRSYDAALAQQVPVQQRFAAQAGDNTSMANGAVVNRPAGVGPSAQSFVGPDLSPGIPPATSPAIAADQRDGMGTQDRAGTDWTSAAQLQPFGGQMPAGYSASSQPVAPAAGATESYISPAGQVSAYSKQWGQPGDDAAQIRAPFAVGYTQAPVYVTTPQPTAPPVVMVGHAQAAAIPTGTGTGGGLNSGGQFSGHPAENHPLLAAPTNELAAPINQPAFAAPDAAAAALNAVGQSAHSPPRGRALRVIANVLFVILIALLCATVYELLKRNGVLAVGSARDAQKQGDAGSSYSSSNGNEGQEGAIKPGQTTEGEPTVGQSGTDGQHTPSRQHTPDDRTNLGRTAQHPDNNGGSGTGRGNSGSNWSKPASHPSGGNNGKSPTGSINSDKPPTGAQQPQSPPDDPQKRAAFLAAVEKTKHAMQDRDLEAARTHLKAAAGLAQNDADRDRLVRVETILANLEEFWNLLREAVARLPAPGELKVRDTYVAIVDSNRNGIIVRAAGRNLSYRIEQMPITLIVAIVEHSFQKTADTKVLLGTFLAIEPGADRAAARRLLEEAARSGRNVEAVLKEVNLLGVASGGGTSSPGTGTPPDLATRVAAVVQQASAAKTTAEHRDAAMAALALLEQAMKEKKFAEAKRLADVALGAARASNNPTLMRQAAAAKQSVSNLPSQ